MPATPGVALTGPTRRLPTCIIRLLRDTVPGWHLGADRRGFAKSDLIRLALGYAPGPGRRSGCRRTSGEHRPAPAAAAPGAGRRRAHLARELGPHAPGPRRPDYTVRARH